MATRFLLVLTTLILFVRCSPEDQFLNSTEKREVARRTEEEAIIMIARLDSLCKERQDSLMPILIDSLMRVRISNMEKYLRQQ